MTVAESFAAYRAAVLPRDASDVQVQECERAFYAGAYVLLMDGLRTLGDEAVSEDEGVAQLEALKQECEAFGGAGGFPVHAAPVLVTPPPADIHHTAPGVLVAEMRPILEDLGQRIGGGLPSGWGFALFLFSFGENGHTFYIANCDRADVLTALHTFISRQTQ